MYNGWEPPSPRPGHESYPTPAPTPRMSDAGIPCPPSPPRCRPIPLPPTTYADPWLHPLLAYSSCPCIEYDVRQPPAYASASNARLEWAHESATNPRSTYMTITCMELPCPFVVHPSESGYDFVTVHDILKAVHQAFSKVTWTVEGHQILSSPGATVGQGSHSVLLNEYSRRLEALPSRHIWAGISEQIAPGNWLLHVE